MVKSIRNTQETHPGGHAEPQEVLLAPRILFLPTSVPWSVPCCSRDWVWRGHPLRTLWFSSGQLHTRGLVLSIPRVTSASASVGLTLEWRGWKASWVPGVHVGSGVSCGSGAGAQCGT